MARTETTTLFRVTFVFTPCADDVSLLRNCGAYSKAGRHHQLLQAVYKVGSSKGRYYSELYSFFGPLINSTTPGDTTGVWPLQLPVGGCARAVRTDLGIGTQK